MKGLEKLPGCWNKELFLLVGDVTKPGLGKLSSLELLVLVPRAGTEVKPQAPGGPSKDKILS